MCIIQVLCLKVYEINSHSDLKSDDLPDNNDKRIEGLMDVPNLVEVNDGAPKRFDLVVIN